MLDISEPLYTSGVILNETQMILTNSTEGSLPARAAAALASRSAVSVLAVSGTSCHQQLWWLHLTLALLGGIRPATVVKKNE